MDSLCINLGDAFLLETPPRGKHLYIAIAPIRDDSYLFVNVTSLNPTSDTSCILRPGAAVPKFIVCESAVAYKYAREIEVAKLFELIDDGSCIPRESCSPNILYKIQKGAISSKQIKIKYKNIVKAFLEIE